MKLAATPQKKQRIQFFNKSRDVTFIAVGISVAVVLGLIGYIVVRQIYEAQLSEAERSEALSLASLHNQERAISFLTESEASVAGLRSAGVDVSSIEEKLRELRAAVSSSDYDQAGMYHEQIVSDSARLKDEDDILVSSYSARLINLQITYQDYEKQGLKVATLSADMATVSAELAAKKYDRIPLLIDEIDQKLRIMLAVKRDEDKKAAAAKVVATIAAQSNGGVTYERRIVQTAIGPFTADILTVDMNRVRVKTFAANESDCSGDCPVKPLAQYVSENGGIAGINGTYFCPPDYAQCAGVKNSFNTLFFDYRSKHYLNSAQNQYSVNPLISFYNGSAHYYTQALGYGRDTSANGVISNHPTLVHNGGVSTPVNLDAKSSGKGLRAGIGFRDSTLWAVVTRSATVPESGYVFTALGATYAMNLDGGGSTALYFSGYKVGPGRQLPNAIVFTN